MTKDIKQLDVTIWHRDSSVQQQERSRQKKNSIQCSSKLLKVQIQILSKVFWQTSTASTSTRLQCRFAHVVIFVIMIACFLFICPSPSYTAIGLAVFTCFGCKHPNIVIIFIYFLFIIFYFKCILITEEHCTVHAHSTQDIKIQC